MKASCSCPPENRSAAPKEGRGLPLRNPDPFVMFVFHHSKHALTISPDFYPFHRLHPQPHPHWPHPVNALEPLVAFAWHLAMTANCVVETSLLLLFATNRKSSRRNMFFAEYDQLIVANHVTGSTNEHPEEERSSSRLSDVSTGRSCCECCSLWCNNCVRCRCWGGFFIFPLFLWIVQNLTASLRSFF